MIALAYEIDRQLINIIDGFCEHLQKQIGLPFGWMLTIISLGTAAIAFTASMLMSDDTTSRLMFIWLWGLSVTFMILFFRRGLWLHMREWPKDLFIRHWTIAATMMRENVRPLRFTALAGTVLLLPGALAPVTWGDSEVAMRSLRFLFVTMAPITIMMYAFCAMPHDTTRDP
jgi:hypothetical protein